jgi:tetratricopeptide (TPR) repeat protein
LNPEIAFPNILKRYESMKMINWVKTSFLCAAVWLGPVASSFAYTATDYYTSGLHFYDQKDYSQAIQYFTEAINLDPNFAAALEGRGDAYYALGQYQQALSDFQKAQSLSPSDQLNQMMQSAQSKAGTAPASGSPATSSPATSAGLAGNSFDQGAAFYQKKQYQAALPYFQQAVRENPTDAKVYYYLGLTQAATGDYKDACVNLTLSDRKQPNPSLRAYVAQLRAKLSPEDQRWVDGQVGASTRVGQFQKVEPWDNKRIGFRTEPSFNLLSLSDFKGNAQANQAEANYLATNVDPTYAFTGSLPDTTINWTEESVFKLNPNLEIGFPVGYLPLGLITDNVQNSSGFNWSDSFEIFAIPIGVNLRYFITTEVIQPWISAGGIFTLVDMNYTENSYLSGGYGGSSSIDGNFLGYGFGGQGSAGVDFHLGEFFVVSLFGGYQLESANNFNSTITSGYGSGSSAQLEVVPTTVGNFIAPVSNGILQTPVPNGGSYYQAGTAAPAGTRPLNVDLSGPYGGLMLSVYF